MWGNWAGLVGKGILYFAGPRGGFSEAHSARAPGDGLFQIQDSGSPTLGPPLRQFEVRAILHCKLEGRLATLREGRAKVTLEGGNGPDEEPRIAGSGGSERSERSTRWKN